MLYDDAQSALNEARDSDAATYKISESRHALILTVKNGNRLIALLDRIFGISDLAFVPDAPKGAQDAVQGLIIDNYKIVPKIERRKIQGHHEYEFTYSPRG